MKNKSVLIVALAFAAVIAAVLLWPKPRSAAPGFSGGAPAGAPSGAIAGAPVGAAAGRAPGANATVANRQGGGSGANATGGPARQNSGGGLPSNGSPAAPATVMRVATTPAGRGDLRDYIEVNGDVLADNTVTVYPDVAGKLSHVSVDLGSKVTRGQVIAEIDPSKPGASYSLSPVYAPISGTITSLPLKGGSTVSTGTVIASIGDIDNLQVSAKIPERYVAVLKAGLTAVVSLEAYPGVEFGARVFRVSPLVDATSRTKTVYLAFDAEDSRVESGMFAKIKLYTTVSKNCVTVPTDAIVTEYESSYVYVVAADSTASKRPVTVGVTVDGVAEIKRGLESGERVVYQGVSLLTDGVAVKDIAEPKTESSK